MFTEYASEALAPGAKVYLMGNSATETGKQARCATQRRHVALVCMSEFLYVEHVYDLTKNERVSDETDQKCHASPVASE